MPTIKWENLVDYELPMPTNYNVLIEFNKIVLPYIKIIQKNIEESQKLTTIRDILLPKLMSGEIDVSEIKI